MVTYIHEFPHPRFAIHYNPPDNGFDLKFISDAFSHKVYSFEIDLHYRSNDQAIVCGSVSDQSPTLHEALQAVLVKKGTSSTVYNDGVQFFITLDVKDTDLTLLNGLYTELSTYPNISQHLSTSVEPGDGPRGITIVITGNSGPFYNSQNIHEDLNHFCIVDANSNFYHDYSSEIINLSAGQIPFQWVSLDYSSDAPLGVVNEYHSSGLFGTEPFGLAQYNVRTYGGEDHEEDLRVQLAFGVDSVNAHSGSIELFKGILLSQQPLGVNPTLSQSGSQALLTWQGESEKNKLYLAVGTVQSSLLVFPRQLNLTYFLEDKPLTKAPRVVLTLDGRLLVVYEGTDAQRLWYITGRFTSPYRFLTFEGRQHKLTLPDDSGRRGRNPSVAVGPDGRVIVIYEGTDNQRIWYVSAYLNDQGELVGPEYSLTQGNARRGYTPSIAIDSAGGVIVVYQGTDNKALFYVSGHLDNTTGQIVGTEFSLTESDARRGITPSVAIDANGNVLIVYEGTTSNSLWYVYGKRDATGRVVGAEFSLTEGDARQGTTPTASFDKDGKAFILYTGTGGKKLWYVHGSFDQMGRLNGQEQLLDMSLMDEFTTDAPMFGFDLGHTRFNPYETILTPTNVSSLVPFWTTLVCLDTPSGIDFISSPAVVNGIVYVGSNDHKLYAINASSGQILWTADTAGNITSSPAVVNGVVYIGSFNGGLSAFDAATGAQRWRAAAADTIFSSPAVANGVVYSASYEGKLSAFDAATGIPLWDRVVSAGLINSSPAVANGAVYIGSDDGNLYAFDASTDAPPLWTFPTGDRIRSSPAVVNGVVYIGSDDGNLYAANATTGKQVWVFSAGSRIRSSPAVANGVVYIGSDDGKLYAVNTTTGKQVWVTSAGTGVPTGGDIESSPTVANGVVYIGFYSDLYAFDASTGQTLWSVHTPNQVESSPTVANGVVYVGSRDGKLYVHHLPG